MGRWTSAAFFAGVLLLVLIIWARLPIDALDSPWSKRGSSTVRSAEETLVDTTRPTPPHHAYPGASERTLQVRYWYPSGPPQPSPLIVYSHGFGGMNDDISYVCEHLASRGYVVAAPAFPATNARAPGGPNLDDVLSQPGDQRFLIDHLLARGGIAGDVLAGRIDPQRIGALGLSLGGMTSILLAFDRRRSDVRIKAVASIVGFHPMLRGAFFAHQRVPFLEIAGTNDEVVPYASNGARVPEDIPGSLLMTLKGGTHLGAVELFRYLRFVPRADALACMIIKRQVEHSRSKADWSIIGSAEEGVLADVTSDACTFTPDLTAMDPRRQQQLTVLGVTAFFDSQFAATPEERSASSAYLREGVASELEDVTVTAR